MKKVKYNPLTSVISGALGRFIPEPRSSLVAGGGSSFKDLLGRVVGGSGVGGTLFAEYQQLLVTQMEVQQQMQLMNFLTNIEKSRHETRMAAIRNVRSN